MSLRSVVRVFLNPGIFAGIIISALLVLFAYQARPGYDIVFGTPTDGPLLDGFHVAERVPANVDLGYQTFRWTTGYGTVTFRDVGVQPFTATLTVNGSRPAGQPPPRLTVRAGGSTLLDVQPPPGVSSQSFIVPADLLAAHHGTFTLELSTNAFHVPGDPRELGIIATRLQLSPSAPAPLLVMPSGEVVVSIVASAALLGLLASLLGWGIGIVMLGGALPGLLAGGLLMFDRLWLTSAGWYESWPGVLLIGGAASLIAYCILRVTYRAEPYAIRNTQYAIRNTHGALLSIFLVAFVVRLGGQLHPQIMVYDLGFHVNRLHLVEAGQLLFTTQPAEFGGFGHSTFYLPTPYLFVIPLNWLLGDERMAVRVLTVLLGSLGVVPLFYLAKKALGDGRAGLFAAALYVCLPMAVLPYSWGITANVFGEFFALAALAVAWRVESGKFRVKSTSYFPTFNPKLSTRPRPAFWWLCALLFVALLSHPGVVAVTGVAFVLIALFWLVDEWKVKSEKVESEEVRLTFNFPTFNFPLVYFPLALVGALGLAAVAAFAVYYNHFVGQILDSLRQIGAEKAATVGGGVDFHRVVGGSVEDVTLGLINREVHSRRDWVLGGIESLWREAVAYYRAWPLLGAVLGLVLAWPGRRFASSRWTVGKRRLVLSGAAWLLTVLLFAIVGWATNVYVRYMLSALPIVALGTGILLSGYWRRGWSGRWLSLLVVAFFAVQAVVLWHYRISYLFK